MSLGVDEGVELWMGLAKRRGAVMGIYDSIPSNFPRDATFKQLQYFDW